jgi:hypothetical protein
VGKFVGALETSVINTLAFTGLCNTNHMVDDPKLLYKLMLYKIHPQVVVRRPFMMVLETLVLQTKCSRK